MNDVDAFAATWHQLFADLKAPDHWRYLMATEMMRRSEAEMKRICGMMQEAADPASRLAQAIQQHLLDTMVYGQSIVVMPHDGGEWRTVLPGEWLKPAKPAPLHPLQKVAQQPNGWGQHVASVGRIRNK